MGLSLSISVCTTGTDCGRRERDTGDTGRAMIGCARSGGCAAGGKIRSGRATGGTTVSSLVLLAAERELRVVLFDI